MSLRTSTFMKNPTRTIAEYRSGSHDVEVACLLTEVRDLIGFVVLMHDTIKPRLGAKGHGSDEVGRMRKARRSSLQLRIARFRAAVSRFRVRAQ